jgi:hypothetical protein
MAQANLCVATQLRKAILNIFVYPRGGRGIRDMVNKYEPFMTSSSLSKQGKEMVQLLAEVFDQHLFNSASRYFDNEAPFQLGEALLSGSSSEGTKAWNLTGNKKLFSDTDFMFVLKNIKVTEEDQKKGNLPVKEETPFVTLYLTDDGLMKTWADFLETSGQPECENSAILSSMKLKEKLRERYVSYGPMFTPLAQEDVDKVDEGPSVAIKSSLPGTKRPWIMQVDYFDLVLAIRCEGWPLCAQEWLARSRCWPSPDIVDKIIKDGFHIVCKSSIKGNFRLSFSNAETILIENVTDLQFKTYRAFKSFVNHYKHEWSPRIKKIFCSYHLKTIALWYFEKFHPSNWNEDAVVIHLFSLIDDLIAALRERTLPMYFMPKCNLLEEMEDGNEVAEKIMELRWQTGRITDGIVSEEPDMNSLVSHVFNVIELDKFVEVCQKCLAKGRFEVSDIMNYVDNIFNSQSELPSRNDVEARKLLNKLRGPAMKIFSDA